MDIVLNKNDTLYCETNKITDIDIICNYVEKQKEFPLIDIRFQDQYGNEISNINWTELVDEDQINLKRIDFDEIDGYTNIPSVYYKVDSGNKIIIYKTPNISLSKEIDSTEYSDRFEIDLFAGENYSHNFLTSSFISVTSNIVSAWWLDTETDIYNTNEVVYISPNTYYINFQDLDTYSLISDITFTLLENTVIEFNIEYIKTESTLSITSNYDSTFLNWNIYKTSDDSLVGENLDINSIVILENDNYYIVFPENTDVYSEYILPIYINDSKTENIAIFNETQTDLAKLQINLNIDSRWQIGTTTDFTGNNTWYDNGEEIEIVGGDYYINFEDVDLYNVPGMELITLTNNQTIIKDFSYITHYGVLGIYQNDYIETSIKENIKWRVITDSPTEWMSFEDTVQLLYGTHTIEFDKIDNHFDTFSEDIYIIENQNVYYKIYNRL